MYKAILKVCDCLRQSYAHMETRLALSLSLADPLEMRVRAWEPFTCHFHYAARYANILTFPLHDQYSYHTSIKYTAT